MITKLDKKRSSTASYGHLLQNGRLAERRLEPTFAGSKPRDKRSVNRDKSS